MSIQVATAQKLSLPTAQDFSKSAVQIFKTNEKAIFRCANSKPSDFTLINYPSKPSVIWHQDNKQAVVWYQKTRRYFGHLFQVVNIVIVMDQGGDPVSILVFSHTTPGD